MTIAHRKVVVIPEKRDFVDILVLSHSLSHTENRRHRHSNTQKKLPP